MSESAFATVLLALIAGAIRVSTPFLLVALGETITEKSGRINLGLEGTLVLGAMVAYMTAFHTGSPWVGLLGAASVGFVLGAMHAAVCGLPRVNDVGVGIAMMSLGTGLAFFFGKPYVQPAAPQLPSLPLGAWLGLAPPLRGAFEVNVLFIAGLGLAGAIWWALRNTRWGLSLRTVGDSAAAARAMGLNVDRVRLWATAIGGALAGVAGAFLSLVYPGSWNEALSSGQGLMAVALVIFARWDPIRCVWAALLFGAAGTLGPALQSVGITQGYQLFHAAPYVLTLLIMALSLGARRDMPGELVLWRRGAS